MYNSRFLDMDTLINQIREQLDSDKIDDSIALMESELKKYNSFENKLRFLTAFENKYDEQSVLVDQGMNVELFIYALKVTQNPKQKTKRSIFWGWIDKKQKEYLKELRNMKEGNKLISDFMNTAICEYKEWNELMPVVEKINTNYNIKIDIGHEWAEVRGNIEMVFLYDKTINLTYKAIIYVIKEINQSGHKAINQRVTPHKPIKS